MVVAGLAAVMLLAGDQLKQFIHSISYTITDIGWPQFGNESMTVPVTLLFTNKSNLDITIDNAIINLYKFTDNRWINIGKSYPQFETINLPAKKISTVTLNPRISIIDGLVNSVLALLQLEHIRYRIGVVITTKGFTLPEQYKEMNLNQSEL